MDFKLPNKGRGMKNEEVKSNQEDNNVVGLL